MDTNLGVSSNKGIVSEDFLNLLTSTRVRSVKTKVNLRLRYLRPEDAKMHLHGL
jgi:hypothetical protein